MDNVANDPALQRFIESETQKQKFNQHVHDLTAHCWDTCVGTPGQKFDNKTNNCITQCVERFLDTSNYVIGKLEKEGDSLMAQQRSSSEELRG